MNPRTTFRYKSCFDLLLGGPMLFSELKWKAWAAEWSAGRTHFVCSKSADYNRSFKRSIQLWQSRGDLVRAALDTPITYGLAARLAVFTVLERGQLSSPKPTDAIRLYFEGHWCSVVVAIEGALAVNLGAVFIGEPSRYVIVSLTDTKASEAKRTLSAVQWAIRLSCGGVLVDPEAPLAPPPPGGTMHDWVQEESFAAEGVALSLRHSTPGRIGPYMLSGEQLARKSGPMRSSTLNVPNMGAH